MDHWGWIYARAYAPAAGLLVLVLALAVAMALTGLQAGPIVAGLIGVPKWVPVALFVAGLLQAGWVTYRLWQAHNGEGQLCHCGGLLGAEREGRADRGGAYRRCYACGDNINHRHY